MMQKYDKNHEQILFQSYLTKLRYCIDYCRENIVTFAGIKQKKPARRFKYIVVRMPLDVPTYTK